MSPSHPEAPFGTVLTAMATAFTPEGAVDPEATARIATHLVDKGHDGVVVSGTTGESPTTSVEEDGIILRAVLEAVGDRAKVVAGCGTNSTAHSVALAKQAAALGAAGILLVTPYYNKPSQGGVLQHFRTVTEAGDLPVMLYDVPGRTGIAIAPETYARAAEDERVVAVKDAVGDFARGTRIMTETGLALYSGDDHANLGWLAHGAAGFVSVAGHACGNQLATMAAQWRAGDHAGALATYRSLMPAMDAVMGVPNYGATTAKGALQLLGVLDNRRVRGPLLALDEEEYEALRRGLEASALL